MEHPLVTDAGRPSDRFRSSLFGGSGLFDSTDPDHPGLVRVDHDGILSFCDEYGVIRMSALRSIKPFGSYHSADRIVVLELLLRGKFHITPEWLYFRRDTTIGPTTSRRRSARAARSWIRRARTGSSTRPSACSGSTCSGTSTRCEGLRSPAREKRECYRHVAAWSLDRATSKVTRRRCSPRPIGWRRVTIARRSPCVTPWRVGRSPRGESLGRRGPMLKGVPDDPGSSHMQRALRALAAVPRKGRGLTWGVADQAVSSLSNFAVNIYVARLLGAEQYGIFASYSSPMPSPSTLREGWRPTHSWSGSAMWTGGPGGEWSPLPPEPPSPSGLVLGAAVLVAAAVLGGRLGLAFVALAVALPGLLLQDWWRFAFFSSWTRGSAFLNDLVWLVVVIPALVALQLAHAANVFWSVLAWGELLRSRPRSGPFRPAWCHAVRQTRQWLTQQRDLGFRYMVEGTTNSASSQLRTYGIGLLLGLAAVGYVQAANTLDGCRGGARQRERPDPAPEATRIWRDSAERFVRFCAVISVSYTALAALWCVFLLVGLPLGLGQAFWAPSGGRPIPWCCRPPWPLSGAVLRRAPEPASKPWSREPKPPGSHHDVRHVCAVLAHRRRRGRDTRRSARQRGCDVVRGVRLLVAVRDRTS